jgi:hypothetical protein
MYGQWTGPYSGTNAGILVLELDDAGDHYDGTVYAATNDPALPTIVGAIWNAPKDKHKFKLKIPLGMINRYNGFIIGRDVLAHDFPQTNWPDNADSDWTVESDKILINWLTNIGTTGSAAITRYQRDDTSKLEAIASIKSWSQFKEYVNQLKPYEFAFRGQEDSTWPLRTSFHRTRRASMRVFAERDVNALHRYLSGLTSHRFNLNDPMEFAAFLNLVQHHGYPTPLLDWTYSPFIAAYFAFRYLTHKSVTEERRVRILVFNKKQWDRSFERALGLAVPFRHITVLEPLAINNPRVVPQQSISMVTNVENIELHISEREKRAGNVYLQAIDLPVLQRGEVMRELDLMGINAGSLFPGLDGACQQLKERFFEL